MSSKEQNSQTEPESPAGRIDYRDYELPRDLNAFQRDLLFVLASIEDPVGARIGEALELLRRKPTNDGQLYPFLDELEEMGLVDKIPRDKRTNEYLLTKRGRYVVEDYRDFIIDSVPRD